MRPRTLLTRAALIAAAAAVCAAAPASASSIVYIGPDGNVWLTSPDGAARYRVTDGGGWRSPSQADNGMIVAQHNGSFYRLTRSGQQIGQPVAGIGGDNVPLPGQSGGSDKFYGPYDPKVSPDGTQIAYWFTMDSAGSTDGNGNPVPSRLDDYVTTTPSDHFEGGPQMSLRTGRSPSWITNTRVLTYHPWAFGGANVSTWVPGGDSTNEQWWFSSPQGIMDDGELSPDGTKLVNTTATDGAASPFNALWFWSVNGAAYTGQPPYSNPDPNAPALPTIECQNVRNSTVSSPTWSPDSRQIAYADKDGVWVENVPATFDNQCSGMEEHLLVPGAIEPDWGPADVNPADAPTFTHGGGGAGGGGTGGAGGAGGAGGTGGTGGTSGSVGGAPAHPSTGHPGGAGGTSIPGTQPPPRRRPVTGCTKKPRRGHRHGPGRCPRPHKRHANRRHH